MMLQGVHPSIHHSTLISPLTLERCAIQPQLGGYMFDNTISHTKIARRPEGSSLPSGRLSDIVISAYRTLDLGSSIRMV